MKSLLETTTQRIERLAKEHESCILMCSLGKDSLVLLDLLYPRFRIVNCVYMYFVKDLEHIERWIRWAKSRYPKINFVQVPHWNLSYVLRSGLFCSQHGKTRLVTLNMLIRSLLKKMGDQPVFLGMKKADSMNRRLMLQRYEKSDYNNKGLCYPLADWTQKHILSYMRMHSLPTPTRYSLKASGGVGFNLDCLLWMRKNYPQDLERLMSVFPLSRRQLYEYDYHNNSADMTV